MHIFVSSYYIVLDFIASQRIGNVVGHEICCLHLTKNKNVEMRMKVFMAKLFQEPPHRYHRMKTINFEITVLINFSCEKCVIKI